MMGYLRHRGVVYSVQEIAPGRWKWDVLPPETVRDFQRTAGEIKGERDFAIAAAKRDIDAQYFKSTN